jgi:calcineurin-like phosphoesterase family protein
MRKLSLVVAIAILPLFGFSQSIFDKYEDMDEVGTVVVNKGMIDLVSKIGSMTDDREAQEFAEVAKGINGIKVFITEDKGVASSMSATVKKYLKSSSMEELMRVKDKDVNVKFYIKSGKDEDHVRELLMFVSGMKDVDIDGRKFETVLVSMTGDIDLNQIGAITNKMNLPDDLKKAERQIN